MIKRLLFVISNSSISGAEKQLLLLLKNLDKKKYFVEVCCLGNSGSFTEAVSNLGLTIHISGRSNRFEFGRLIFLFKLLKLHNYDWVISYCYSANQYTRIASLFSRSPHIACERGHDYSENNIENFLIKILSPISRLILFNSKVQMASYKKNMKYFQPKIKCIYNGISIDDYADRKLNTIYDTYNLNKDVKIIGTIGNFSEHKNFNMFIDVCEKLYNVDKNIHFFAIGEGPAKKHYIDIISKRQLGEVFTFTGYIDPVFPILSQFDVFLLTSSWEGMPNVVMEAMLNEVPVVSTNIDGSRELINHGENGFLVNINDNNTMVKFVLDIVNKNIDLRLLTNKAKSDIIKKYSLNTMIKNYQRVFDYTTDES